MEEKKKEVPPLRKCSRCKKRKIDVRRRLDPYLQDVEGVKKYIVVCDDCEQDIGDDI